MSYFFKNTKRFSIIFTSLILAITLTAGSFAALTDVMDAPVPQVSQDEETDMLDDGISFDDISQEPDENGIFPLRQMSFNIPSEMDGVYLVPGSDFLKSNGDSADTVTSQIDTAVEAVAKSGRNAVIIDTVYGDKVIYNTADSDPKLTEIDLTGYITEKCRENGLFVYAIFDASHYSEMDKLEANISEFATKYNLDGILVDGYEGKQDDTGYGEYIRSGGSMGYDNFKNQTAALTVKTASKAIRKAAPDTQAGLLAGPVWANIADNNGGSDTKAEYTSLMSGFADTRSYIELGWFDFVAVKADVRTNDANAPFGEIASWWSKLAEKQSIPMYMVYPTSKVGSNGWTSNAITEQISVALSESAYQGAIFDSVKNTPDSAAGAILPSPATSESTDAASMIKPLSTVSTAVEAVQTIPVKAEPVNTQASEALWSDAADKPEDEAVPAQDLIRSISPMGAVTGEIGEDITITAIAHKDADVIATLNGETVYLALDTGYKGSDPNYSRFTGVYTVPEYDEDFDLDDSEGEQFLGALSVYASSGEREDVLDGAYFASAKKTDNSRYPVQVTVDQARVYPTKTRDVVPVASMYPLPKGTIDYAIGKPVTVRDSAGVKHTHLILESGMRIDSKAVKEVKKGVSKNSVQSLSVSEKSGYTYIWIRTEQKVAYAVGYTGKEFTVTFANTTSVPGSSKLQSNKMFSKATWSGKNKLSLTMNLNGGFMGYKAYYEGENLVFRFNNPPSSIKTAKIYVDPGHGGSDTGAIGKNPTRYEKDITLAIAKKLTAELQSRGATVKMYNQSQNIRMPDRVIEAEKWGADMIVSIHCNASGNPSAKGTEVYYFYPFSKQLAINTSYHGSRQISNDNRGAKQSYYHITLSPQVASVMVETGFLSNASDYKKLRTSSAQQKLAIGVANGIEGAIKTAYTGKVSNGSEFKSPNKVTTSNDDDDDSDDSSKSSSGKVTSVAFSAETATIKIGESMTLKPTHTPSSVKNVSYTWKSSNTSTITVDDKGKITGVKAGTATITATADDGSKKNAKIRVTVSKEIVVEQPTIDVSGIALSSVKDAYIDEDFIRIYPGNKQRVEICSENGVVIRGADFTWHSSNAKAATVDTNGVITARAVGTTTVTATGGNYTFTCEVEVDKTNVAVKGIELEAKSIVMVKNTSRALRATVLPKSATDKVVRWSSSNDKIAEVNSSGVIIAKNAGKVTITAKTKTGGYTATCNVEILNKHIDIEEITTDEGFEMKEGDTDAVYVRYYPENVTVDRSLTFTSSNPDVVTVDSEGNVKALKKGTATITATLKTNKNITSSCTITVL